MFSIIVHSIWQCLCCNKKWLIDWLIDKVDNQPLTTFWDLSFELGLGKRHWNLETSSAVIEFPPPYLIQLKNKKEKQEYWTVTIWCNSVGRLVGKFIHVEVCPFHHYVNFSHSLHRAFHVCFHFQRMRIIIHCEKKINIISSCCECAHFFVIDKMAAGVKPHLY